MLPKRKYAEIVAKQHYCRSADERDVQFEQRSHRRPGSTWGLPPDEAARPQNCLAEGLGLAHKTKAEQGHQHCRRHHTPREPFPPTGKKPHDPSPRTSFRVTSLQERDLLDYRCTVAPLDSPRWGIFSCREPGAYLPCQNWR